MTHFFNFIARHKIAWLLGVSLLGIVLDQASKIWAQSTLARAFEIQELKKVVFYPIREITVIPNFFNLIYKENPAAAFSLTSSIPSWIRMPLLIGTSLVATLFFIIWYFRKSTKDGLLLASFSFILAGAIGNLIDRIRLGYVIDFLDIYAGIFAYPDLHWPTFNVADSLIVVGAIGVLYRTFAPKEP